MSAPLRILLAKIGLDGHDRGIKVVARALRDAGMEVIYTGIRLTPEQVVAAALQEDVRAIGVSLLSGAHMTIFTRVMELLHVQGADRVLVFGGGTIPKDDVARLRAIGVGQIFGPGTMTADIVAYLHTTLQPQAGDETLDGREPHPSRRSQEQGSPQGERRLALEDNDRTARPEEPPSSGGVSRGAGHRKTTVSEAGKQ